MTPPNGRTNDQSGSRPAAVSALGENTERSPAGPYSSHESSGSHPSPTSTHVALDPAGVNTSKVESENDGHFSASRTPAPPMAPTPLQRTATNGSYHAQTSLRRMATHETGGYDHDEHPDDGGRLDTHDEETSSDRHEESKVEGNAGAGEEKGKKKEPVLQDQTNLLPAKQIWLVFVGLTCAVFCSLLDQTM